ncbi:uncharacterized protein LOC126666205 isoform X2 [Mercurialis annua]|uniref:uncharacterized protein LOC126666205 isoform X2 n=1 Tax=Mercurialis annua TaxID=3986 RepID=UPI00215E9AFA|nr:uncharacterized protein LOC126666205 isoform X2 [Mercurialis annua]
MSMEDAKEKQMGLEIAIEKKTQDLKVEEEIGDDKVLQFLDSLDTYLTLSDSLSSTLRQGWFELTSARHSMGASRLNSVLLDLKPHPAATSLQLTQHHDDSIDNQPQFILRKWGSVDDHSDVNTKKDEFLEKPVTPQLRHRGNAQLSEESPLKQDLLKVNDEVQKERSRSLSVFGTLVSPKLRASQLSFETALETLVEIANARSAMLSAFGEVREELNAPKR